MTFILKISLITILTQCCLTTSSLLNVREVDSTGRVLAANCQSQQAAYDSKTDECNTWNRKYSYARGGTFQGNKKLVAAQAALDDFPARLPQLKKDLASKISLMKAAKGKIDLYRDVTYKANVAKYVDASRAEAQNYVTYRMHERFAWYWGEKAKKFKAHADGQRKELTAASKMLTKCKQDIVNLDSPQGSAIDSDPACEYLRSAIAIVQSDLHTYQVHRDNLANAKETDFLIDLDAKIAHSKSLISNAAKKCQIPSNSPAAKIKRTMAESCVAKFQPIVDRLTPSVAELDNKVSKAQALSSKQAALGKTEEAKRGALGTKWYAEQKMRKTYLNQYKAEVEKYNAVLANMRAAQGAVIGGLGAAQKKVDAAQINYDTALEYRTDVQTNRSKCFAERSDLDAALKACQSGR